MNQRLVRILGGKTEQYPHALESRYPRILETIMSLWDDDKIDDYFMELMVSDRGDRSGFPPDIAAEIMHLSLIHASQESPEKHKDIWDIPSDSFVSFTPRPSTDWAAPDATIRVGLQQLDIPCTPDGFFAAAESGNRAAVALFIEAKISTEIRDNRGWTPLMLAAFRGSDEVVRLLIQHDADVNALDMAGNSALHWAAVGGHVVCATQLIQHHARIDLHNMLGWTPLMQATARNHADIITLLINSGANLDAAANDGQTSLHIASASGYDEIVRLLLAQGADKTLKNGDGDTAEKLALKNRQENVVRLLAQ